MFTFYLFGLFTGIALTIVFLVTSQSHINDLDTALQRKLAEDEAESRAALEYARKLMN